MFPTGYFIWWVTKWEPPVTNSHKTHAQQQNCTIFCYNVLVHSFITSRQDSCNALLHGIPKRALKDSNTSRTLLPGSYWENTYEYATYLLRSLHWLPITFRTEQDLPPDTSVHSWKCSPLYFKELLTQKLLQLPRTRHSALLPLICGMLPPFIWEHHSPLIIYKKDLKHTLFKMPFLSFVSSPSGLIFILFFRSLVRFCCFMLVVFMPFMLFYACCF